MVGKCLTYYDTKEMVGKWLNLNVKWAEVNDHVSLQWPSLEQPYGLNLRSQRKQTF